MNTKIFLCLLILVGISPVALNAQGTCETVTVCGGTLQGIGGSASYSVGQISFSTHEGVNGAMEQGIQHPNEIIIITNVKNSMHGNYFISAFPNPTQSTFNIKIRDNINPLKYKIVDISGKVYKEELIYSKELVFNIGDLSSGTYFIALIDDKENIFVAKIIKN